MTETTAILRECYIKNYVILTKCPQVTRNKDKITYF